MDVGKYLNKRAEQGAVLVVKHPATGKPTDIEINLIGTDSAEFQAAAQEIADRRVEMAQKPDHKLTGAMIEMENVEALVRCTKGWTGMDYEGEPLHFSHDNARMIYNSARWLREQVATFIDKRANFFADSPSD